MKTLVEIECPNVDIMTVHNIRYALRYYFPHFSFTVTEIPPLTTQGEQPAAPVAPAVEEKVYMSCAGCTYDFGPHLNPCNTCCDGGIRRHYKPAAPVAPAAGADAPKEGTPVAGWEKEGICSVCNKPVNFTDGFIWDGKLNKPVHYECRDVVPCPSCEKLRGEFAELKRFSSGLITKYNNLVNEMFALNQAKGEK